MMIPPLVRVGYPTEPIAGIEYVVLLHSYGWAIVRWAPTVGFFRPGIDSDELVSWSRILCWMPQDGT